MCAIPHQTLYMLHTQIQTFDTANQRADSIAFARRWVVAEDGLNDLAATDGENAEKRIGQLEIMLAPVLRGQK